MLNYTITNHLYNAKYSQYHSNMAKNVRARVERTPAHKVGKMNGQTMAIINYCPLPYRRLGHNRGLVGSFISRYMVNSTNC